MTIEDIKTAALSARDPVAIHAALGKLADMCLDAGNKAYPGMKTAITTLTQALEDYTSD